MNRIPAFIVCRDRLSSLKKLVEWLEKSNETEIILVDNVSVYPPMVKYLDETSHIVIKLRGNIGPYAPWKENMIDKYVTDYFLISDADVVPKEDCPMDAVSHLISILETEQFYSRHCAGLGLEINDLPDYYYFKKTVLDWEGRFWHTELAPGIFEAPVDTTFAVYRRDSKPDNHKPALRTGKPYMARHMTWYIDPYRPTPEESFYRGRADNKFANWSLLKENLKLF